MNTFDKTPLMVALEEQAPNWFETSLLLVRSSTYSNILATASSEGDEPHRTTLGLAAQAGHGEVINEISEIYDVNYRGRGLFKLYDFGDVDMPDSKGRNALFYAKNSAIAKKLAEAWRPGVLQKARNLTWLNKFMFKKDDNEQSFLHLAAIENRLDVIRWGVGEVCGPPLLNENSKNWLIFRWAGKTVSWLGDLIEAAPLTASELINHKDSHGNTALHLSVQKGNLETSLSLLGCRKLFFGEENNQGQNVISFFLLNQDKSISNISEEKKTLFKALVERKTEVWPWNIFKTLSSFVKAQDTNLDSALHHAARLSDPYFYDLLLPKGDPLQENGKGETPEFLRKRLPTKNNGK